MRFPFGPFRPIGVLRTLRTRFLYRAYDAIYTARTRPPKGVRASLEEVLGPSTHSFDRVGRVTRYLCSKAPRWMERIHRLLHSPHELPLLASATEPLAFGREASCIALHGMPRVLKVHRSSLGQTVPELVRIARKLEGEYHTLMRWYGPLSGLLPRTMHVVMCVPLRGVRGVVRIQDFVPAPRRDLLGDFSDDARRPFASFGLPSVRDAGSPAGVASVRQEKEERPPNDWQYGGGLAGGRVAWNLQPFSGRKDRPTSLFGRTFMKALLHDWVTEAAQRRPDARAIVGEDATLSYGEIEAFSNRLAHVLKEQGCRRGDRVGVLMPHSARAVAAFIGALKAGCVYVPLDPTGGMARTFDIIRQTEPRLLLVHGCAPGLIEDLESRGALRHTHVGWLDAVPPPRMAAFTGHDLEGMSGEPLRLDLSPDDPAYILFASRTDGFPLGIPISHGNVQPFAEWAVGYFGLGPQDRLSGHTPLTFGLSAFDIFVTLRAGAELHQVPRQVRLLHQDVTSFIRERGLTLWLSVPSPLERVARFRGLDQVELPSLRHVAWSGDVLRARTLLYWKERLPGVQFTNLYGTTEATVASCHYRVPDDFSDPAGEIPIGTACPGEELLVLDAHLQPVPEGAAGDLYLSGVGLSTGYLSNPERTRAAFFSTPGTNGDGRRLYRTGDRGRRRPGGAVTFLGPAEFQIGTSGQWVEPVEVEKALLQLDEVTACVVVPVKMEYFSEPGVGCAYVPRSGNPLRTGEITERLAHRLPRHMIPTRWMVLDELPRDSRGKVDRVLTRILLGG